MSALATSSGLDLEPLHRETAEIMWTWLHGALPVGLSVAVPVDQHHRRRRHARDRPR